jgi:hypothetical protein
MRSALGISVLVSLAIGCATTGSRAPASAAHLPFERAESGYLNKRWDVTSRGMATRRALALHESLEHLQVEQAVPAISQVADFDAYSEYFLASAKLFQAAVKKAAKAEGHASTDALFELEKARDFLEAQKIHEEAIADIPAVSGDSLQRHFVADMILRNTSDQLRRLVFSAKVAE